MLAGDILEGILTCDIVYPPQLMNELLNVLGAVTSSQTLNMILLGVLIYIGILWIALILWVTKDITNRTNSMSFQIISISMLIFLTPVFGLPLYLLIRPSRTLMERYFEEVEQDMIEQYYDSVERFDAETIELQATAKDAPIVIAKKSKKQKAEPVVCPEPSDTTGDDLD